MALLIRAEDLSDTHMTFNFQVVVRKDNWNLKRNDKFDLAMTFYVPTYGNILLQLDFEALRYKWFSFTLCMHVYKLSG